MVPEEKQEEVTHESNEWGKLTATKTDRQTDRQLYASENYSFFRSGICLVDETEDEPEDSSALQLAEGIKVAYTVPDTPQSQVNNLHYVTADCLAC